MENTLNTAVFEVIIPNAAMNRKVNSINAEKSTADTTWLKLQSLNLDNKHIIANSDTSSCLSGYLRVPP